MVKKRLWLNEVLSVLNINEKWFVRMAQIRHLLEVLTLTLLMLHGVARLIAMSPTEFLSDSNIMHITNVFFAVFIAWLQAGIIMFFNFVVLVLLSKWAKQKFPFQISIRSFTFIVLKLPVVPFALIGSPKWFFISFLVFGGLRVLLFGWKFWCYKKDGEKALFYCSDEIESSSEHDFQVK